MADVAAEAPNTIKANKIPVGAWFFMAHNVAFSFAFDGIISIYGLFLRNKIGFSTNTIVSMHHFTSMLTMFFAPIGALIADSASDRFVLNAFGRVATSFTNALLVVAAIPKLRHVGPGIIYTRYSIMIVVNILSLSALFPFIGNQFKLPEQQPALLKYYQIFYFFSNLFILIAYYLIPALKTKIACLGEQDCFIFGFGLTSAFTILSSVIFLCGYPYYIINKPDKHIAVDIFKCIGNGFIQWLRERKTNPRPHWLDHAQPAYGTQLVEDIKRVYRLIIVFSVMPIYNAVYFQMDSKWLFQATRLDGRVGSHVLIPELFLLLNPTLAIVMLILCMKYLDPAMSRWKMDRLFRRMIFGGTMLATAFVCAGLLETAVKSTNPVLPQINESQLRIFNGLDCDCIIKATKYLNHSIEVLAHGVYTNKHIPIEGKKHFQISISGSCIQSTEEDIYLEGGQSISVHIKSVENEIEINTRVELVEKTETGLPVLTALGADAGDSVIVQDSKDVEIPMGQEEDDDGKTLPHRTVEVVPETYKLYLNGRNILDFKLHLGGIYVVMISEDSATLFAITEPNSVHLAWIIPQSILLIFGEVYYGISFSEFTYSEAPLSLQALTQSIFNFFSGLGDLIIVMITAFGNMDQDFEFYLYVIILLLDMVYLTHIALRFKSIHPDVELI